MKWFQRHLNWTWFFAYLIWWYLNGTAIYEESATFNVLSLVALIFLTIVSGWVIKHKGRRLWWIFLTPIFSPLWLGNKKYQPASDKKESKMPFIQKARTGTGCLIQLIGGILWLGCGIFIMIWEFNIIADALSTGVAVIAVFLFPILLLLAVPIAWILTGAFPLMILILWLLSLGGMLIMSAGASIKGE